jgi:hypothetical protein
MVAVMAMAMAVLQLETTCGDLTLPLDLVTVSVTAVHLLQHRWLRALGTLMPLLLLTYLSRHTHDPYSNSLAWHMCTCTAQVRAFPRVLPHIPPCRYLTRGTAKQPHCCSPCCAPWLSPQG